MRLGQMFLVGFDGCEIGANHWLSRAIRRDSLGGVILFDRNISGAVQNVKSPEQLRCLTSKLRLLADAPLFIAVDQEGGKVCRLKERDGFPGTVTAATLAEQGIGATGKAAAATAALLHQFGINLNFAPVVDLAINPCNPIISRYERSFSADPLTVARHALSFIQAHHQAGIGCCLKHFPGHGSAGADSHLGFVDVTDCWQEAELEPYRLLIAAGFCDGIMTAHLVHRRLDPDGLPATLSAMVIQGLLRERLGFQGVIFSDDLQMRAIMNGWGYAEAVQQAVLAGVDVLVVGNNLSPRDDAVEIGIRAVEQLLDSGRIDAKRIEGSLGRIARFKDNLEGKRPWNTLAPPTAW